MRTATVRAALTGFVLSLLLLAGAGLSPAAAQDRGFQGVQLEASGLWTTLVGGAFPFDETGLGATAGLHYRWPGGFSIGAVGMKAQPEDLTLPADDVRRHMTQWAALGEFRYYLNRLAPIRPYVGGRVGWTQLDDERGVPDGVKASGVAYGLTAGTEIRPSDRVALRLAATGGGFTVGDYFDPNPDEPDRSTGASWTAEAGLAIFLGSVNRTYDTDADGVPDGEDGCPRTPAGVAVDSTGCALDGDGDGVASYLDDCPGTVEGARVDRRGCPTDSDGDGVADGLDECPGTSAGMDVNDAGCAVDADGDGVPDDVDQCADTPSGASVTQLGCARDSDGDGVRDGLDRCSGTPAGRDVDEQGCSQIEAGIERGRLTLDNIHFAFGSARLTENSRQILREVGEALVDRPNTWIEIQGHTDSIGSEAANLQISRARARSVRLFLLEEFPRIDARRLQAVGLGETRPVAANDTEAGRAQNRRVEFVVTRGQGGGGGS